MLIKNNWAFFISKNKIEWQFYQEKDPEFIDSLVRLTKALQSFGEEFLGEAIGSLVIGKANTDTSELLTILFIRLSFDTYLVISQPETTALLLEMIENIQIPETLRDQVRGVLIGAALSTYSRFWGSDLYVRLQQQIDEIFQHCLSLIGAENRVHVGGGTCSLAELSMSELILFHHFLQKTLETKNEFQSQQEWSLIADLAGAPIYLIWNLDEQFATSLTGLLCVIHTFTTSSFGYKPIEMTFGISNLVKLSFFSGKEVFCAMAQPKQLLKRPSFNKALLGINKQALSDIQLELRTFIERQVAEEYTRSLKKLPLSSLLTRYTGKISEELAFISPKTKEIVEQVTQFIEQTLETITMDHIINDSLSSIQVLVLGASKRVKNFFNVIQRVTPAKTLTLDDFSFEMYEVSHRFFQKKLLIQFWFVEQSYLDNPKFFIISSTIFNADCLIVPYSFGDRKWLPPITRHIENYWNYSGKSSVNTIILLLEGNEDHIYYKEAFLQYSQLKKRMKTRETIQFLPVTRPDEQAFRILLNLIVAQKVYEFLLSTSTSAQK